MRRMDAMGRVRNEKVEGSTPSSSTNLGLPRETSAELGSAPVMAMLGQREDVARAPLRNLSTVRAADPSQPEVDMCTADYVEAADALHRGRPSRDRAGGSGRSCITSAHGRTSARR